MLLSGLAAVSAVRHVRALQRRGRQHRAVVQPARAHRHRLHADGRARAGAGPFPAHARRPPRTRSGSCCSAVVAVAGDIGKGAQRWLDLGVIRFQPSEILKLAVPMMCAWYLHQRPLPPSLRDIVVVLLVDRRAGRPDRRAARPRHGAAGRGGRHHRAGAWAGCPGLRARRGRGARRGGAGHLALHARLPAPARADAARPAERRARRRLPHHPVADRDRLGRRVRQGLDERQPGAARVPARALDRLHLRGDRRGARPARPGRAARRLPVHRRPRRSTCRCSAATPSRACSRAASR